jgi:hypothetical protein
VDRAAAARLAADQAAVDQAEAHQPEADQLAGDQVEATATAGAMATAMATAGAMVEVTAIDRLFPNGATSALPHYWRPPTPGSWCNAASREGTRVIQSPIA